MAKFAPLLRELVNSYLMGKDGYARSVLVAHKLLVGWEGGSYTIAGPSNNGILYTTIGDDEENLSANEEGNVLTTASKKKVWKDRRGNVQKCYTCEDNHYANMFDKKEEEGDEKTKACHLHLTMDDESDFSYKGWGQLT
eukprot:15366417-Ditylum_brightwellii.AAC.1